MGLLRQLPLTISTGSLALGFRQPTARNLWLPADCVKVDIQVARSTANMIVRMPIASKNSLTVPALGLIHLPEYHLGPHFQPVREEQRPSRVEPLSLYRENRLNG